MTEIIHLIKKYANGRLYDATDKKYITMAELGGFLHSGVPFSVVVSKTDEDITESIAAKLKEENAASAEKKGKPAVRPKMKAKTKPEKAKTKARAKVEEEDVLKEEGPPEAAELKSILGRLLRKSGGAFSEVPRKSAELLQSAMTMAEEEFDKRIKQLVKGKEMSESEAKRLKEEILGFTKNLKTWVGENVEERITDVLSMMNLATRDQLEGLEEKIDRLNEKLRALERMETEREETPMEVVPEEPTEKP